jgi:hypothetical protein
MMQCAATGTEADTMLLNSSDIDAHALGLDSLLK